MKRKNMISSVPLMKMSLTLIPPMTALKVISLTTRIPVRMNYFMPGKKSIADLLFMTVWHNSGRLLGWGMQLSCDRVAKNRNRNLSRPVVTLLQPGQIVSAKTVNNLNNYLSR